MAQHRLSYSQLNNFKACPKCFYVEKNLKIKRPEGIKSSLPTSIDGLVKDLFDKNRPNFPAGIEAQGHLIDDNALARKLRHWATCWSANIGGHKLIGAFDDLAIVDGLFEPVDYKTKGSEPNDGYTERYYQTQADVLSLLILSSGRPITKKATYIYFYPGSFVEKMEFKTKTFRIDADPERGEELFNKAVECLDGEMPEPSGDCEYCAFATNRQSAVPAGV